MHGKHLLPRVQTESFRISRFELFEEMFRFKLQLSAGDGNRRPSSEWRPQYFGRIKPIAPLCGLLGNMIQVRINAVYRRRGFLESEQLGMMLIPLSLSTEHLLRQQSLTPERYQAFGI